MASKRRIRRKQCEGKKKYPAAEDASAAAHGLHRRTHHRFNTYKCQFCKRFHVGHTPYKIRRAIAAKATI